MDRLTQMRLLEDQRAQEYAAAQAEGERQYRAEQMRRNIAALTRPPPLRGGVPWDAFTGVTEFLPGQRMVQTGTFKSAFGPHDRRGIETPIMQRRNERVRIGSANRAMLMHSAPFERPPLAGYFERLFGFTPDEETVMLNAVEDAKREHRRLELANLQLQEEIETRKHQLDQMTAQATAAPLPPYPEDEEYTASARMGWKF